MKKFWYVDMCGLPSALPPTVLEVEAKECEPGWWEVSPSGPYALRARPQAVGMHIFETREAAINKALDNLLRDKGILEQRISILTSLK